MEKIKWAEKITKEVLERIGEKRTLHNNILLSQSQLGWTDSKKKLPSSWCHWKTDEGSEKSKKKINEASRLFEKQKKLLRARGRS